MTLSLPDIDAKLASLTSTSTSIEAKLAELDETIKTFTAAGLTGRSADAWNAVAPRCGELWRHFLAFRGTVQEAVMVRGTRPQLPREQLDDLTRRLVGNTVTLPEDPSALLSTVLIDTSRKVSMDSVVTTLSSMYQEVATVANSIVQAWEAGGRRVAGLSDALTSVGQAAQQAGITAPTAVATAQTQLASIRTSLARDPLELDDSVLQGLAQRVDEARLSLEHAVAAKAGLGARLAAARGALDALAQGLDQANALRQEVIVKIGGAADHLPELAPLVADLPVLRSRLDGIAGQAGDWEAASGLLDALDAQVAAFRAAIFRSLTACRGWMDRRNDLRGLLSSYQAKANATGRGEDPGLSSIYERARDSLYSAPCDVAAAGALVDEYQRALNRPRANDRA